MSFHPVTNFLLLLLPVASLLSRDLQVSLRQPRHVVQPLDKHLLRQKLGLVCADWCEPKHLSPFSDITSWFYNYKLGIDDAEVVAWMNEQRIEYVPMIVEQNQGVPLTHHGGWCRFDDGIASAEPVCTVDLLVSELAYTMNQMDVKPVHLMGWNEPFAEEKAGKLPKGALHNEISKNDEVLHNIEPHYIQPSHDAVNWWRRFVQPVAEQMGLRLVSPTSKRKEVRWLGDFLTGCWDNKFSTPPCSIEAIEVFAVHEYACSQGFWETGYGGLEEKDSFQSLLANVIGSHGRSRLDWEEYIRSRKIWVTETNCNWDWDEAAGSVEDVSPQEMCDRITGYGGKQFGEGSIKTMIGMDAIERFAWWNTFNPNLGNRALTEHARLVDSEGALLAPGRALVSGLDPRAC